ncbi:MAG TPA: hypothetical protein VHN36_20215 [Ilumatobacteraceae bacterium]|nr:hypothetical protein [Ilumatobacteraceae bacterium]
MHAIVEYLVDVLQWLDVTVDPDDWNEDGKQFWAAVGFVPVRTVIDDEDRQPYTLMRWDPRP